MFCDIYKRYYWLALFRMRCKNRIILMFISCLLSLLYLSGIHQYLFTLPYLAYYTHNGPRELLSSLILKLQNNSSDVIQPINNFQYPYIFNPMEKCRTDELIRILFVITSTVEHFQQRKTIRETWGDENRFSDVTIRRVFLLARKAEDPTLQSLIEKESNINRDIIQGKFEESYENLTTKTMMGLDWTFHQCKNVSYYFFADDDNYVSTRNILRFLRNPMHYPNYLKNYAATSINEMELLYAGKLYKNSWPIRCYFSKLYVSLKEYPYSYWPPYISGGFYTLSRMSLENLYYGSIYTKYFRLEDVFLGMAAKKAGITLLNTNEIYFPSNGYQWALAVHGFHDNKKLAEAWNQQRAAGNA